MKILLLINWKIKYCDEIPDGIQPSDYSCPKETFWFFKYFNEEPQVDVVDISAPEIIEKIENKDRSKYIMIGDTKFDIIGANLMKIDSLGVSYGYGNKKEMLELGALKVLDSTKEIADFLLN